MHLSIPGHISRITCALCLCMSYAGLARAEEFSHWAGWRPGQILVLEPDETMSSTARTDCRIPHGKSGPSALVRYQSNGRLGRRIVMLSIEEKFSTGDAIKLNVFDCSALAVHSHD